MRRWRALSVAAILLAGLAIPGRLMAQAAPAPAPAPAADAAGGRLPRTSSFLSDPQYSDVEKGALWVVLLVAVAGLVYAGMLVGQVLGADQGTEKMRTVGRGDPGGGQRLPRPPVPGDHPAGLPDHGDRLGHDDGGRARRGEHPVGRAAAFFMGAAFSWIVGYVGMSLAVRGNLRVAAAARTSYGGALQLGYRTGTITGMLTDGLGLLGGTVIFMAYGEHAYEVLLGFGFGGTLLALFMRVGGGIYTKAADVGADLVGKVEAGIPEDDPRNAATIADNVGDNVGDCAGMAADIFESYEVTIVAAMILGYASFGHKGVIFPLLVRAIGVVGSIISTYSVKAGPQSTSDEALHSVHRGFILGSIISVAGFFALGLGYLHFNDDYIREYPQALGGYAADARVRRRPATTFEAGQDQAEGRRRPPGRGRRTSGRGSRATKGPILSAQPAVLVELRLGRPRHAAGLDLPDRDHPGDRAEQVHELLHAHAVRAGEVAGQGVPDRPRDEHHPGVRRRLRVDRGGGR